MAHPSADTAAIIARLEALASPEDAAGMARFGIRGARVLGVPVKTLRAIARESAARRVGNDALRELTSEKVARRVARREL